MMLIEGLLIIGITSFFPAGTHWMAYALVVALATACFIDGAWGND